MEAIRDIIERFQPGCEREEADRRAMLLALAMAPDTIFTRENELFHFTAASIIVNPARTHTLMAWHNLYRSWAWTGGHADGDPDLMAVAAREAWEETGIRDLRPLSDGIASLEVLSVAPHVRRGAFVSAHLHLNVTYAFEADDALPLRNQPDENARVGWLPIAELPELVSEADMLPIYQKILARIRPSARV